MGYIRVGSGREVVMGWVNVLAILLLATITMGAMFLLTMVGVRGVLAVPLVLAYPVFLMRYRGVADPPARERETAAMMSIGGLIALILYQFLAP